MKFVILITCLISLKSFAFEVDSGILDAIAKVESNGNDKAESPVGARGKYQFMEKTWNWLWIKVLHEPENSGFEKAYDPVLSRKACSAYLIYLDRVLKTKGLNSKENILAAYNGGIGNVIKSKGIPNFKETQSYVKRVLNAEIKAKQHVK